MMRSIKVAYVPAHLPGYEAEEYEVFRRSRRALEEYGAELGVELLLERPPLEDRAQAERVAHEVEAEGADLVVLQSSSFAMGDVILPFADRGMRICLWAPEEPKREGPIPLNSLVSMHLYAGVLRQYLRGAVGPFKWLYGDTNHPWFCRRLDVTLRAVRGLKAVEGTRIGLIGGLAPSFLNLAFDERELRRRWGVEVDTLELTDIITSAQKQPTTEVEAVVTQLKEAVDGRVEVTREDMRLSAAVYLALRAVAGQHGFSALAVSDWPLFQKRLGLHPGMAFSWLDEHDGIPVASEGDVLGAVSMLLGRGVAGDGAMLLDVNDVDLEHNALLMWHCGGSPLSLADERGVRWTPHTTLGRKSGGPAIGTVADFHFRHGPVTILRVGNDGKAVFTLDADVIDSPHSGFDGSRGWVSGFRTGSGTVTVADVVNTLIGRGVEHHLSLAGGHHAAAIREAAAWVGAEEEAIVPYRDELSPRSMQ